MLNTQSNLFKHTCLFGIGYWSHTQPHATHIQVSNQDKQLNQARLPSFPLFRLQPVQNNSYPTPSFLGSTFNNMHVTSSVMKVLESTHLATMTPNCSRIPSLKVSYGIYISIRIQWVAAYMETSPMNTLMRRGIFLGTIRFPSPFGYML